jgi:hypothetical protein
MTLSPYAFPGIPQGAKYINAINITEPIEIIQMTSECFGVHVRYIIGKSRKQKYVYLRFMVFSILYDKSGYHKMTLKGIGSALNRDHSTVIHGLNMHNNLMDTDEVYKKNYISLYNHIAYGDAFVLSHKTEKGPEIRKTIPKADIYKMLRETEVGGSFLIKGEQDKWKILDTISMASNNQKFHGHKYTTTRLGSQRYRFTRTC